MNIKIKFYVSTDIFPATVKWRDSFRKGHIPVPAKFSFTCTMSESLSYAAATRKVKMLVAESIKSLFLAPVINILSLSCG